MVNKVVHLADIHIRLYRRFDEYRDIFNKFFTSLEEIKPDRIVICGDIVHSKINISPEMISMVVEFFERCASIAKTIIIPGNHDFLVNNLDRLDSITPILSAIKNDNIVYYRNRGCYDDENIIWCVYSQFEGNLAPNIHEERLKYGKSKTYIGLFHGALAGSKTPLGFDFEEGYSLKEFDGCDMVMCGDIHLRQDLYYKDIPIVYSGSLIQQDFGELVDGHGYLIWDVTKRKYTPVDIDNEYAYHTVIVGRDEVDNILKLIGND